MTSNASPSCSTVIRTSFTFAARTATTCSGWPSVSSSSACLLARGADPNRGNDYGWTKLHQAGYLNRRELAEVMLAAGAHTLCREMERRHALAVVGAAEGPALIHIGAELGEFSNRLNQLEIAEACSDTQVARLQAEQVDDLAVPPEECRHERRAAVTARREIIVRPRPHASWIAGSAPRTTPIRTPPPRAGLD
jgi:hypothetical protein